MVSSEVLNREEKAKERRRPEATVPVILVPLLPPPQSPREDLKGGGLQELGA